MMESIKMAVKLFRYGWAVKTNVLMALVFFLFGIVLALFSGETRGVMSSYMLLAVAGFPSQVVGSLNVANMVQASPWKRRMQTSVLALTNGICTLIMYLLILGIKAVQIYVNPDAVADIVFELLMIAVLLLIVMLYYGASFKMMYPATVLFLIIFIVVFSGGQMSYFMGAFAGVPLWVAVCSGFGAILAGTVLEYGLMRLLYKRPLSKAAQNARLRKYM